MKNNQSDFSTGNYVPMPVRVIFTVMICLVCAGLLTLAFYGGYMLLAPDRVSAEPIEKTDGEDSGNDNIPLPPLQQEAVVIGPELDISVESPEDDTILVTGSYTGEMTAAQMVEQILPSVVGITAESGETTFSFSGVVLSEDGYLVTCAHLVENADSLSVVLRNGKTKTAKLVGSDERTDIAVLKISATSLIPVSFVDSDGLSLGISVYAVGNPGGATFTGSVNDGILSCGARNLPVSPDSSYRISALQTTAEVNPGNVGGPLCNSEGKVVGLCSDLLLSEDYPTASFAIPSSVLVSVAKDLVEYGRVTGRVWLGIEAVLLSESAAQENNLPAGIMIADILDGSNLGDAGVMQNDILLSIDGKAMNSLEALRDFVDSHEPGDLVLLSLYRRGQNPYAEEGETQEGYMVQVYLYLMEDDGEAPDWDSLLAEK